MPAPVGVLVHRHRITATGGTHRLEEDLLMRWTRETELHHAYGASRHRSMHAVQVGSTDNAESQKRIVETVGRGVRCELSELYLRFRRDFDDASERRLGYGNDVGWSKEPHFG